MGQQRGHQAQQQASKVEGQQREAATGKRNEDPVEAVQEWLGTWAASRQWRAEMQQRRQGEGASPQAQPMHHLLQSISAVSPRVQGKPLFRGVSQEWRAIPSQLVIQRCGNQPKQAGTDKRVMEIMPLFKKLEIDVRPEDIRIVKDERSDERCHKYALQGFEITNLYKFSMLLETDEITCEQRGEYDVVIAAYSSDGASLDHTARWEKGKDDEFVHKLSGSPYFACNPVTYQHASKSKYLWYFGYPKKERDEQPREVVAGTKTRKIPPRGRRGNTPGTEPQRAEERLTEVSTEQPPVQQTLPPIGQQARVIVPARLRADDSAKTALDQLKPSDIVTIPSQQKAGSRFALGGISIAQDHYWVITATGQQGWVRKNAVKLG